MIRSSIHVSVYYKIMNETLIGSDFTINFKTKNEINVKLHCQVFSDSEPLNNNDDL